jgi:hypothetical protein
MKEDIIRMAREAGWPDVAVDNLPGTKDMERLKRFAVLVASAEREACAKAFEAEADTWTAWAQVGAAKRKGGAAIRAAKRKGGAVIRARGQE